MKKLIVMVIVTLSVVASEAEARGPFGRRYAAPQPTATPPRPTTTPALLQDILRSPQRMTELYGPSILIREAQVQTQTQSRFVRQPEA